MDDEPLEGDIGPSAPVLRDAPGANTANTADEPRAGASSGGRAAVATELRRLEDEREERRRRTNAAAGRVAFWLLSLFLAFLAYDSARTAHEARQRGDDWVYPPAVNAGLCVLGVLLLVALALRRRRRSR
ncbi:hypothetical protein AB0L06_36895 [Spirillospora sp. NPDC052269]